MSDTPQLDRYNAIRADWQSDQLYTAVQAHDDALARHLDVQARLTAAQQAAEAAKEGVRLGDGGTLDEFLGKVQSVDGLTQALAFWQIPEVVRTDGATDKARSELGSAMGSFTEERLFLVAAALESAAFETWPKQMRLDNRGPITLPAEEALIAAGKAWKAERDSLVLAIQSWESPVVQGDSLLALERADSLLNQIARLRADGVVLAEKVAQVNAERRRMGIEWQARGVKGADMVTQSAELRALERFRAEREAVPV